MAVMQTAQGRVIGLIIADSQPKAEPVVENKPVEAKKPGRPAKK